MATDQPLTILCICTGNVCRSALAQHYLAEHLERPHPEAFRIRSAGLGTGPDLLVPRQLYDVAPDLAERFRAHRTTSFDPDLAREADLILAATAAHRSGVLTEAPAALKRTFTITEFAAAIATRGTRPGPNPDAWRELIAAASQDRGRGIRHRDVPDPYGRSDRAYAAMADILLPALKVIVAAADAAPSPT